jgi:pteridine reductase
MDLKGKTVFVTGGAKRVGLAIARAFADRGADLVLHYRRSEAEALAARDDIRRRGVRCEVVRGDFADPAEAEAFAAREAALLAKASVLVNSASVFPRTPLGSVTAAQWREVLSVNVLAPFFLARTVGASLKAAGREGAILNVTDASVLRPYRDHAPYFASKAALANLTKALAWELAPVRVNSVAPGAVLFPDGMGEAERKAIADGVPLRRAGSPEDVAAACVWLAASDYVNGATLAVDGGRT